MFSQVGEEFSEAAASYVTRFLARGIPSLFSDLKGLYGDKAKVAALQKIFEDFESKLAAGDEDIPGLRPSDCSTSDDNPPALVSKAQLLSPSFLFFAFDFGSAALKSHPHREVK